MSSVWRRRSRATVIMLAGVLLAGTVGCAEPLPEEPAVVEEADSGFDVTSLRWDPSAVEGHLPGLVGWSRLNAADPGGLVAIPESGEPVTLWEAPAEDGVLYLPLAVDATGPRMLVAVTSKGETGDEVTSLVLLGPDGDAQLLETPEGYEGVLSATFVGEGVIAVVSHATSETFETLPGTFTTSGAWEPLALEGEVPAYQFIERVTTVPDTDAVALLLKTPGGTGDRDDEALVLAKYEGGTLVTFTTAFRDDSLPGASPLWGSEGVVFPRTWRVADGAPVVDLVTAVWADGEWTERVLLEAAAIASGIETGQVATQAEDGTLWVRSAGTGDHAEGGSLLRLDAQATTATEMGTGLAGVDWFVWLGGMGDR
ncbi:MAG: hypothetical protein JW733_08110 [Coriobacteriia bacterium]|nr:hypothetical protein [Coriobacteriia bacterium]